MRRARSPRSGREWRISSGFGWRAGPEPGALLAPRRLAGLVAVLALLAASVGPSRPIRFLMATAGHLHAPARWLSGLLAPRPVPEMALPSHRALLEAVQSFYAAAMPAAPPRPGHRFLATAVLERAPRDGLLWFDRTTAPVATGDVAMIHDTIVGFVAEVARDRLLVSSVRRRDVILRVHVRLPDGGLVRALAEGDPRRPDLMVLRYPERPSLLRAGLPVFTAAQEDANLPPVSDGGDPWTVDVPGGRLLGRLVADPLRSMGVYRSFFVAAPPALQDECRGAVESSVEGPGSVPYPGDGTAGWRLLAARARTAPRAAGNGLDISTGIERGVGVGQAVSSDGVLVGRVEEVGLFNSRVRRPLDGGLLLSVVAVRPGLVRRMVLDLAPRTGQFRVVGSGAGLRADDWVVTSGGDPDLPSGLLVGRVARAGSRQTAGRLVFPRNAGGSVTVWCRGSAAGEDR